MALIQPRSRSIFCSKSAVACHILCSRSPAFLGGGVNLANGSSSGVVNSTSVCSIFQSVSHFGEETPCVIGVLPLESAPSKSEISVTPFVTLRILQAILRTWFQRNDSAEISNPAKRPLMRHGLHHSIVRIGILPSSILQKPVKSCSPSKQASTLSKRASSMVPGHSRRASNR